MTRLMTAASLLALLAACDNDQPLRFAGEPVDSVPVEGEPVLDEEGEPVVDETGEDIILLDNGIPTKIANDLAQAVYNPRTDRLEVQITSLDTTPLLAEYVRTPSLDVGRYSAFIRQEDPLDRMFVAFARETTDGDTRGVLVKDGGQFTKYFAGIDYERDNYSPHTSSQPDDGLVSYAGQYVGILNTRTIDDDELLDPPSDLPGNLRPGQPARIVGTVLINADFTDNTVNGGVADRVIIDNVPGLTSGPDAIYPGGEIEPIFLIPTDINDQGTFFGDIENRAAEAVGLYSGAFGGAEANGIAVGIDMRGNFLTLTDNEEEQGLIILDKCGSAGDTALCDAANP